MTKSRIDTSATKWEMPRRIAAMSNVRSKERRRGFQEISRSLLNLIGRKFGYDISQIAKANTLCGVVYTSLAQRASSDLPKGKP